MKLLKTIVFTFLLLFVNTLNSQELRIPLEKSHKIESTFSGDINQESTVHIIIRKDKKTKDFVVSPLFYDKNKKIIRLDDLVFKTKPKIISYHQNQDTTLTFLFSTEIKRKEKVLAIVDYNLKDKKSTTNYIKDFENPDLIFKQPDKSILANLNVEKNTLKLMVIDSGAKIQESLIIAKPEQIEDFSTIFDTGIDAINTNEYVKFGSFRSSKAFVVDNSIKFIHVEEKDAETTVLDLELDDPKKLDFTKLSLMPDTKIKDINFYFYDDKIFYLTNANKRVSIKVIDITTQDILYKADLVNDLGKLFDSKEIGKYVNKTAKSYFSPTVTVNSSVENNMVVNLGFVDNRVYNYYNDWWFHHWMWQQQMMQPPVMNTPNFGPNPSKYEPIFVSLDEEEPFQLVLDSNCNVLENASKETKKIDIDKDEYKDNLGENYADYLSLAFTGDSARFIYFVKSQKTFILSGLDYN